MPSLSPASTGLSDLLDYFQLSCFLSPGRVTDSVAAADAEVAETAVGDEIDFLFVGACCSSQLTVVCMLMSTAPVVLDKRLVSSMWMCVIHGKGQFLTCV